MRERLRAAVLLEDVALHDVSAYRFARVSDGAVVWRLRRNCSVTPRQLGWLYASLCGVSLAIGGGFWWLGAPMVIGFAGLELLELLALGVAFLAYARHAADGETVSVREGLLIVERERAGRRERLEFDGALARVAPPADARGLIELRFQGRRVDLGCHVRPECRAALAGEMRQALLVRGHAMPR